LRAGVKGGGSFLPELRGAACLAIASLVRSSSCEKVEWKRFRRYLPKCLVAKFSDVHIQDAAQPRSYRVYRLNGSGYETGSGRRRDSMGPFYRIVVRSELSDRYAGAFEGMQMETRDGKTILTGELVDQPHLHDILDRINGLGLKLLSVQDLSEESHYRAEGVESHSPENTGLGF
jgi:hypothetical protein